MLDADLLQARLIIAALVDHRAAEARLHIAIRCTQLRRIVAQRVRRAMEHAERRTGAQHD